MSASDATQDGVPVDPWLGLTLDGRYTLLRRLGSGGMGVVYEATQRGLDRTVAIKLLHPHEEGEKATTRFVREGRVLSRLTHPGIVTVHDTGQTATFQRYLVMERVDGIGLDAWMATGGSRPVDEAIRLAAAIADALDAAHRLGIVHRDLKPANIILVRDAPDAPLRPKLLDFGIAHLVGGERATQSGTITGTAAYLAPEIATGGVPAPTSDIYALGVLTFELLAGRRPFEAPTLEALLLRHVMDPIPSIALARPDVNSELDRVVTRLLAKSPGDRPATGGLARDLLLAAATTTELPARAVVPGPSRRIRPLTWLLGALVIVGAAATVWWLRDPAPTGGATRAPVTSPEPVPVAASTAAPGVAPSPPPTALVAAAPGTTDSPIPPRPAEETDPHPRAPATDEFIPSARVTFKGPAGTVLRGGSAIGRCPSTVWMASGPAQFVLQRPGHPPVTSDVTLSPGAPREVSFGRKPAVVRPPQFLLPGQ